MANKKCVICGEPIKDEIGVPYKQRYAHQKCFNIAIKALQTDKTDKLEAKNNKKNNASIKPKAELKDCLSEEEYSYKTQFYDYIRTLTADNQLSAKVYALSDNYIKRYSFTFEGMFKTIKYLVEYADKAITGDIVGIIPYYYDEAQGFYNKLDYLCEKNKTVHINDMYKTRIVKVQVKKNNTPIIDIENIK